MDAYFNMLRLAVGTSAGNKLAIAAVTSFRPYKSIVYKDYEGYVVPCINKLCLEPIYSADGLREFLKRPHP
jgi:hypothetical protein